MCVCYPWQRSRVTPSVTDIFPTVCPYVTNVGFVFIVRLRLAFIFVHHSWFLTSFASNTTPCVLDHAPGYQFQFQYETRFPTKGAPKARLSSSETWTDHDSNPRWEPIQGRVDWSGWGGRGNANPT